MNKAKQLIDRLEAQHSLSIEEYEYLIENQSDELAAYAAEKAVALRKQVYGTDVYIRGLIEIGNICRNDCYYCGIRRSNTACDRYRLTEAQILDCAREGYALGFRTFVMQGGEDSAILSRCGLPSGTTDQSRVPGLCSNAVARRVPS